MVLRCSYCSFTMKVQDPPLLPKWHFQSFSFPYHTPSAHHQTLHFVIQGQQFVTIQECLVPFFVVLCIAQWGICLFPHAFLATQYIFLKNDEFVI